MSDVDEQFRSKEKMFGQTEPRGWKWFEWLGWNKIRRSEGSWLVRSMFLSVQAWSVGEDLAAWKG